MSVHPPRSSSRRREQDLVWVEDAVRAEYERYWTRYLAKQDQIQAEVGVNHFAADLFSAEELVLQRLGRSSDSILGNTLESLAHRLARRRFPDQTPSLLRSGSVTEQQAQGFARTTGMVYVSGEPKTIIVTDYNRDAVDRAAASLASQRLPIGSADFDAALDAERAVVRAADRETRPWAVILDFYCADDSLGMGEIKSGGNLDNTKAKVEVQEMIKAALVCDQAVPLRAFICYANRGYGVPIQGALPTYFEPSHLLVDRDFWTRLLPPTVTWEDFQRIRQRAGRQARELVEQARHETQSG